MGRVGASGVAAGVRTAAVGTSRLASKKDFTSSMGGVMGVTGDESIDEESLPERPRKLRSMVEKSESLPELIEEPEDDAEMLRMSGAVRAWRFVVEINSVGREIILRVMVPCACLTVPLRVVICSPPRLTRLVKALAKDIAGVGGWAEEGWMRSESV